ncbi:hypothetical protein A6A19_00290 [Actinobacillus delphinicola]|nr:hypothetical protein [Actinobacillus delphinicola]
MKKKITLILIIFSLIFLIWLMYFYSLEHKIFSFALSLNAFSTILIFMFFYLSGVKPIKIIKGILIFWMGVVFWSAVFFYGYKFYYSL